MSRRVRPRTDVKVSAVIPFFNDGVVVEEALDSLRRQTRAVDQIVVVDDGSTDASSLSALAALERAGITVVRQHNQGPGPARNFGVAQCDGDAILFLDSTDVVTEQHVERALATLAGAPDEVGFVYPDMQFLGNESHLVVMPPYNLYLLLHRNFCCMGGIIDRSVFEAGFGFRTDRPVGHEDWDFFVRLGIHGVFGHPFHGAPLGYRRWGYSLSDGVTESAAGLAYVRDLHPDLNRHGRLIEIKREWAPALSVVIPAPGAHIAAHQTCDDFEVVAREGAQVPPTRGRWVLLLDEEGMAALADESFVERVLRLVGSGARPSPVALHAPAARDTGWTRSPVSDEDGGTRRGVVAEGHYYLDWSRTATATATPDVAAFCAYLDAVAGPVARWSYADRTSDVSTVALSDFRRSRPPPERPGDPVEFSGSEVERAFRHHEAVPLFMPDGGLPRLPGAGGSLRDGLGAVIDRAWSDWMPARSRQLDLVVDVFGQATLETGDISDASSEATARQPARIPIGLLWTQPFPGTACLAEHLDPSSHAVTHRVTLEKPAGPGVTVLGYVPTEFLPGRIGLLQSIGERMEFVVGPQRVSLHPVVDLVGGAFVEPSVANAGPGAGRETPDLDPPGAPADAPASRPRLRGRRRAR